MAGPQQRWTSRLARGHCLSASERRWFMHAPHPSVGVAVDGSQGGTEGIGQTPSQRRCRLCVGSVESPGFGGAVASLQKHLAGYGEVDWRSSPYVADVDGAHLVGTDSILALTHSAANGSDVLRKVERLAGDRGVVAVRPPFVSEGLQLQEAAHVEAVETARDHLVLDGVGPFECHGPLQADVHVPADAAVMLRASFGGKPIPVAWLCVQGTSLVFYTSLGHPSDFQQEPFLQLLANAIAWTSDRA